MVLLETDGLSVSYGGLAALSGVSLKVREGQVVGLIGPNGAGKTTFIDALTGFVAHRGSVRLETTTIDGLSAHARARLGVGRTWQAVELFDDLTVRDNLRVGSDHANLRSMATDVVRPNRPMDTTILDQIAALEWVQRNIGAFGGDPAQVTIAGESAGGMSVATLLATPRAKGLFRRAVAQSGAGHNGIHAATASMIGGHLLDQLAVKPGDLADLLSRTPQQVLDAQIKLSDELTATRDPQRFGEAAASAMAFQPTYGTDVLPSRPIAAIAAGAAGDVDVLVGTTFEEALIFVVDLRDMFNETLVEATLDMVMGQSGRTGKAVLDVYRANRPGAQPHELAAAVETDRMFRIPAIRLADAQAMHNPNTRMYQFMWRSTAMSGSFGACHFLEVPFVFDSSTTIRPAASPVTLRRPWPTTCTPRGSPLRRPVIPNTQAFRRGPGGTRSPVPP